MCIRIVLISRVDATLNKDRTMGRVVVKGQWLKSETTIRLAEAQIYTEKGTLSGCGTSKLLMIENQRSMDDVVNEAVVKQ